MPILSTISEELFWIVRHRVLFALWFSLLSLLNPALCSRVYDFIFVSEKFSLLNDLFWVNWRSDDTLSSQTEFNYFELRCCIINHDNLYHHLHQLSTSWNGWLFRKIWFSRISKHFGRLLFLWNGLYQLLRIPLKSLKIV